MNGTKPLVVSRWRSPSGIGQPKQEILYTFFVQTGQFNLRNFESLFIPAEFQKQLKGVSVGTDGVAAQVALYR